MPFFSKCRNSGNNGRNCTIFGAQGDLGRPFDFSTFDLGVTSRDNVQGGVLVNVQEWGCFSIFRRANDVTQTMSKGGVLVKSPPSGNPVSARVPFFSKCRNSGNNGRNCTIFGAQGDLGRPFDFSTFDLGVTSRDLSMPLTVLKKNWGKWTLAPKLLGLEWCHFGKS